MTQQLLKTMELLAVKKRTHALIKPAVAAIQKNNHTATIS